MNVTVIAKSDKGVFAAVNADGDYFVISLDDTRDIDIGDVLRGEFNGHGSLFYAVHNVTQGYDVRICLEDWECSRDHAFEHLKRIGSPTRIFTQ